MSTHQERFNTVVGRISVNQVALNGDIHEACVMAIGHAMFHGDVSLGNKLIEKTKGADRKAIAVYLVKFGPFTASQDGFKLNRKFRNERQYDEAKLMDGVKWYEFVPSKKQVMASFDVAKRLLSVLNSAKEHAAKGDEVENMQLTDYLDKALRQYNHDKAAALRAMAENSTPANEAAEFQGQAPAEVPRTGTEG